MAVLCRVMRLIQQPCRWNMWISVFIFVSSQHLCAYSPPWITPPTFSYRLHFLSWMLRTKRNDVFPSARRKDLTTRSLCSSPHFSNCLLWLCSTHVVGHHRRELDEFYVWSSLWRLNATSFHYRYSIHSGLLLQSRQVLPRVFELLLSVTMLYFACQALMSTFQIQISSFYLWIGQIENLK
jgi:hypothetical protein